MNFSGNELDNAVSVILSFEKNTKLLFMKRRKLGTLVDCLSGVVDKLPERLQHLASRYTNRDTANSAFGAFFSVSVIAQIYERTPGIFWIFYANGL